MWFIAIGVVLLLLNTAGIGPVGEWTWGDHWWALLMPFALAVVWWAWADWSGFTQRTVMKAADAKRDARRQKNLDNLGLNDAKKPRR